jgi:hypothetical protein
MAISEIEHLSIFINANQINRIKNCQSIRVGLKFFRSAGAATFTLMTTCFATHVYRGRIFSRVQPFYE